MDDTTLDGALRGEPDGRAVRFERHYPTGVHDLWAALTEPERVARWLDPVTGDLQLGGRVHVHFDDGVRDLLVVDCSPPSLLRVQWQDQARTSMVTVRLAQDTASSTRLVLDHTLLSEPSAPGYAAGWHCHLDALGAHLDGAQPPPWAETFDSLLAGYAKVSPSI